MKLNDIQCKSAKPKDKAYKLFDGGGLFLEVTPKNSKLWRLKYRVLNKEKKLHSGKTEAIKPLFYPVLNELSFHYHTVLLCLA